MNGEEVELYGGGRWSIPRCVGAVGVRAGARRALRDGRRDRLAGERLESEVERAADVVLAGRFPEALAGSLVEHHVMERLMARMVDSGELDRMISAAVSSAATERLVRDVAASPVLDRLLGEAAESPKAAELMERLVRRPEIKQAVEDAVRAALARSTATLRDRVVAGARGMDARLRPHPVAGCGAPLRVTQPMLDSGRGSGRSWSTSSPSTPCSW